MANVAKELFRVLKKGRKCAVLIGDVRKNGRFLPLEDHVLHAFLDNGFSLDERIIKEQHHDKSTSFYLKKMKNSKKHWLAHEYLLIFNKPL